MSKSKEVRHVLGISGGKDSASLAIYLKQQGPYTTQLSISKPKVAMTPAKKQILFF